MAKSSLEELINKNKHLFWYTPDEKKKGLSPESVVEFILNYGTETSVRDLFDTLGIETTAKIFYEQSQKTRSNYFPLVSHYFHQYFSRHVPGYPHS